MARRGESGDWSGSTRLRASRFVDVYHRLVTRPWWVLMVLVGCAYLAVNVFFGWVYTLTGGISGARSGNFLDGFSFSVETLSTIGYGAMEPESTTAHLLVTLESIVGLMGVALVAGLVFAKFSLPISRILFSDVAELVVSLIGLDESLSQTIHARKLYDSDCLLWGRRYVDIVERLPDGRVRIDNRRLSETKAAAAPEWR